MNRKAIANLERLRKIFTYPEYKGTKLQAIEEEISENLHDFLRQKIVAEDIKPKRLEVFFHDYRIPEEPIFVSEQAEFLLQKVVAQSVNTSSPKFIGHMASALPYFMLPLTKIMTALNQNLVKTETSKSFTPLERQVVGMLHHLVYQQTEEFYRANMHSRRFAIGTFCSGGTIANLTALWVARNKLLPPQPDKGFAGVRIDGVGQALRHYSYRDLAIIVSRRSHYSLTKAADILGIGRKMLISVDTDKDERMCLDSLRSHICKLQEQKVGIIAIIGTAGTTETGSIDPLPALREIANTIGCHFHVDASWGGVTLFSRRYRHLLHGIAEADSVTIDAHKQLYSPIGAGIVLFKRETDLSNINQQANYIIRDGSRDLGKHTVEGSRPGMALLVHSSLRIFGSRGFELTVEHGINRAKCFADMIEQSANFELMTAPYLNILTYRFHPECRARSTSRQDEESLNRLTTDIQRKQRGKGVSFVSRTTLRLHNRPYSAVVFRVVLANPLTTDVHLREILVEQEEIAHKLLFTCDGDVYNYQG